MSYPSHLFVKIKRFKDITKLYNYSIVLNFLKKEHPKIGLPNLA